MKEKKLLLSDASKTTARELGLPKNISVLPASNHNTHIYARDTNDNIYQGERQIVAK
jgi:hypothetical protein